ncbi:MAG TPA: acetate uptake transporter [Acidimicrobiales bacterium]|nr:acetate uptake transporter [Acidimicrobiales bacterium]
MASQPSQVEANVSSRIADPAPLGLAGFAMTTFLLSLGNSNLVKGVGTGAVLALALVYGGLAQLLAGMWEFKNKNTFGALAFTSYGAFWLAFFYYVKYIAGGLGAQGYQATGYFLLCWTIFTAYMTIASLRTNVAVVLVFVALTVTFLFLTIGALDQNNTITHIGGYVGLVTAVLAWYASLAGVTNATWKRVVFPVGPLT